MDGTVVTGGEDLLARARAEVARPPASTPPGGTVVLYEWLPPGARRAVDAAHTSGLQVPFDERLEALGRAWANDADLQARAAAANVLGRFAPSAENTRILRRLLIDPGYVLGEPSGAFVADPDRRQLRWYLARQAAAVVLAQQGKAGPAQPPLPHPTYARPAFGKWLALLLTAALAGALIQRRVPRRRVVAAAVRSGLLASSVMLAILGFRSHRVADLACRAGDGVNTEFASVAGQLALLRVSGTTAKTPLVTRTDLLARDPTAHVLAEPAPGPWFAPLLTPTAEVTRWGLSASRGTLPGLNGTYNYRLYQLPHAAVIAGLMVWPTFTAARGLGARARERRRRRKGRCANCGYDLRGADGRCPECGESTTVLSRNIGCG
jgi:hypothetical protein